MTTFYASYSGTTAIDIQGSITATNPSVGATGTAVPADATYIGMIVSGDLTGVPGTANGMKVDGSAVTQPVSGTITADQGGSWSVSVSNFPATQPVSGTVTADQGGSWTVAATQSGSWTAAATQSGTWNIGTLTSITDTVTTTSSVSASTFQDGSILYSSLTTSYQTVITTGGILKNISARNNTNGIVQVSFNGGSTVSYTLDSGDQVLLDLASNGGSIASGVNIQAKYSGSAPTSGSIRVNGYY